MTASEPADATLAAYRASAERYIAGSSRPAGDMLDYLDRFAASVGPGPVLEIGSGPGWDADHLEDQGVRVLRSDAVPDFVQRALEAGHDVRLLDVRHDDLGGPYRAVLADAVLLHLPVSEFQDVLGRLRDVVEPGGFLGLTLKEGDGAEWTTEKIGQPRVFRYWRAPGLRVALATAGWEVVRLDHSAGRSASWLYVLARRPPSAA